MAIEGWNGLAMGPQERTRGEVREGQRAVAAATPRPARNRPLAPNGVAGNGALP